MLFGDDFINAEADTPNIVFLTTIFIANLLIWCVSVTASRLY